jgi:hypothetical protein
VLGKGPRRGVLGFPLSPTAQQSEAVTQETEAMELRPAVGGFGVVSTSHSGPLLVTSTQRSIRARPAEEPTSQQFVRLVQSTASKELNAEGLSGVAGCHLCPSQYSATGE